MISARRAVLSLACVVLLSPLGGCLAAAVVGAGVGVAGAAVSSTAKVAGAVVGAGVNTVGAAGKAVTGGGSHPGS